MGLRAQVSDLMELVKDRNKCMNPKIKYPKIQYPKSKYRYYRF